MHRTINRVVMAVVFGLATTMQTASAQGTATGTLVGHLVWCKTMPRPVGQSDGEPSPLADVTPGMAQHALQPASISIPASDVQVSLLGTSLTATTDADGRFTLTGVPAAQALTLVVSAASGPALVLNGPSLDVTAGQTRDLGYVGLVGCDDDGAVLTVAPAPAPGADGTAATSPEQPPQNAATDAAQRPDPGVMTDASN
jgi:hypothetical protein